MPDSRGVVEFDPTALVASIERLESRVAALERALAARPPGEAALGGPGHDVVSTASPLVEEPGAGAEWSVLGTVTLTGRTLIALGGGYLLRALTEGGVMPPAVGVLAGLAYTVIWVVLCVRGAARSARVSAIFHGLTAAMVGFPLLWEATTRFALFEPAAAALVVGLFTMLLLLAARRAGLESVAWFGALGGTATAMVLAVATSAFIPYTLVIAAAGITALWLGYLQEWILIRWPVAGAVNLMVLVVTLRAVDPDVPPAIAATLSLQLVVLALYLGSFVARTLFLGREVIFFEVAQSAAAMAVCFGGALWVLATIGASAAPLGVVALLLGAAAYAFALSFIEPRGQPRNVMFFTSLALAFTIAGLVLLLPLSAASIVMAALALACCEWARRSCRLTLAAHGVLFAAAMAGLCGLAGVSTSALLAAAADKWPALTIARTLALATLGVVALWPLPVSRENIDAAATRAFRFGRLLLLVWMTAGAAVAAAVALIGAPPGAGADAGVVAAIRTVILVAVAGALVGIRHRHPAAIRIWLSYGVLAAIGLKLLAEDLFYGSAATLFVALAAYGAALILVPRLARKAQPAA